MTNQQILEKAIQKAIDGGWKPLNTIEGSDVVIQQWQGDGMVEVCFYKDSYEHNPLKWVRELEGIIFNHDFAKALWGEDTRLSQGYNIEIHAAMPIWQHHLMLMVIAEDPIEYLGANL